MDRSMSTSTASTASDATSRTPGKMGKLAPQFPVALKEIPAYIAQPLPRPRRR
jgi:hypothetical protein